MKKNLLSLFLVLALAAPTLAENVVVTLLSGRKIEGKIIMRNDTSLIIERSDNSKEITLTPARISSFRGKSTGKYISQDGRFIPDAHTLAKISMASNNTPSSNAKIISDAFKTTGIVSLSTGVPCLVAGTILTTIGNTVKDSENAVKCATAGCYLMPMGAALTIVGIPLYIKGKRIGEANLNYVGNGVGVSLNY